MFSVIFIFSRPLYFLLFWSEAQPGGEAVGCHSSAWTVVFLPSAAFYFVSFCLFPPICCFLSKLDAIFLISTPLWKPDPSLFHSRPPGFPPELRNIKAAGCVFEGHGSKSSLTVNKLAPMDHRKEYSKSLQEVQSQFSLKATLLLLLTISWTQEPNRLLKPHRSNAITFSLQNKPNKTKEEVTKPCTVTLLLMTLQRCARPSVGLMRLHRVKCGAHLNRSLKSSTCALDPFPTALL